MGRSPCCDKVGLKKGPWTPEEDQKLLAYIEEHGHGSWRALPTKAGLQRCGKSCRLRWTNYLRPDIKRGKFSLQEEQTIIQLHALLGNRWSAIATHLPKRTDNEIKNYWNTHLKKRLTKMGIDPVTHKPKNDALVSSSTDGGHQSKNAANLSHMAQWESARLEAEARLVRESRLRAIPFQHPLGSPAFATASSATPPPRSLDVLNAWQGIWSKSTTTESGSGGGGGGGGGVLTTGLGEDLESPTSTLTFSENNAALITSSGGGGIGESSMAHMIDFVGNSSSCDQGGGGDEMIKEEGEDQEWKGFGLNSIRIPEMSFMSTGIHDMAASLQMDHHGWSTTTPESLLRSSHVNEHEQSSFMGNGEGFTDLLLSRSSTKRNSSDGGCDTDDSDNGGGRSGGGSGSDDCEENKNYWNTILNLVNSSPPDSPMF